MHLPRLLRALCAALLTLPAVSAQTLWTVDDDGGADALDIPAAVALASDGDVILVEPGSYSGFTLDGLGVDVVGRAGALVVGTVDVRDLGAGQDIVLRGLEIDAAPGGVFGTGVRLTDCDGLVLVEDVHVTDTTLGFEITRCADVGLMRCSAFGTSSILASQPGRGVLADDSSVSLYACDFRGGSGVPAACDPHAPGGDGAVGVQLTGGFLFDHGSSIEGGYGGDACETLALGCSPAGDGGDALRLVDVPLALELGGGGWTGGIGGNEAFPTCFMGQEGNGFTAGPELVFLDGDTRGFSASSPVKVGGTSTLTLAGENGDQVFLILGFPDNPVLNLNLLGMIHVTQIVQVVGAGSIVGGPKVLHVTAPPIPGLDVLNVAAQPIYVDGPTERVLGPVSVVTIVP